MGGIGSVINNVVGGITGTNSAANAQINAASQSNAMQQQMYQQMLERLNPYLQAGQSGLNGLQSLVNDRGGALNDYYNSREYADLASQARYQQLAGAEATGGLGATATGNALASIAPQLGQGYLNNRYNTLSGLAGMGLSAAGAMNQAGGGYANAYGNNMSQIGAAQAGQATAGFNSLMNTAGLALGAYQFLQK